MAESPSEYNYITITDRTFAITQYIDGHKRTVLFMPRIYQDSEQTLMPGYAAYENGHEISRSIASSVKTKDILKCRDEAVLYAQAGFRRMREDMDEDTNSGMWTAEERG